MLTIKIEREENASKAMRLQDDMGDEGGDGFGDTHGSTVIAGVSGLENETFTKVGKLVLVDLAGNERLDETIQYFTESS